MAASNVTSLSWTADVFQQACPSRAVLDLLADKWTLLVICALRDGPERFGALRRRLQGVTQKMLTQTLRALERDGLVTRTVHPTKPPSVEYALTGLGSSCLPLMDSLREWAEQHARDVLRARRTFDEREAPPAAPAPRHGRLRGVSLG